MSKPERNRLQLLRSGLKLLCRDHDGVKLVTDVFQQTDGLIYQLECLCRRGG